MSGLKKTVARAIMQGEIEKAHAEGYAAGYAAGQREMRHRAMDVINHNPDAAARRAREGTTGGSRYIYDLPIIEEPKEKDK